jgi:hypothetical protein
VPFAFFGTAPGGNLFFRNQPHARYVSWPLLNTVRTERFDQVLALSAFTPNAAFAPTNVILTVAGANASHAQAIVVIDTLNLSASTTPVPDIVA